MAPKKKGRPIARAAPPPGGEISRPAASVVTSGRAVDLVDHAAQIGNKRKQLAPFALGPR